MNWNDTATATVEASPPPADLWSRYRSAAPGGSVEDELVQKYLPLVKTLVGRVAMSLPAHVSTEDLHSAGTIGLLNAIRHFNPKTSPIFESYARVRIRGAVLDELRRMDWAPRSLHVKARQVESVLRELEQAHGRAPTDEEMAARLKMSRSEYEALIEEIQPAAFVYLDAAPTQGQETPFGQNETIADERQENPRERTAEAEIARLIIGRLEQLPEMQRKVLALYYFEDLRLREIAEAFGVSESRISQLHTKAILSLRAWLAQVDPGPA